MAMDKDQITINISIRTKIPQGLITVNTEAMNRKPQQPQKKQNPIWDTVANIHAEKLKASVPVVKEQQVSPTVPEPKLEAPKPHSVVPMSTKTSDRHVIQPGQAHTF